MKVDILEIEDLMTTLQAKLNDLILRDKSFKKFPENVKESFEKIEYEISQHEYGYYSKNEY